MTHGARRSAATAAARHVARMIRPKSQIIGSTVLIVAPREIVGLMPMCGDG